MMTPTPLILARHDYETLTALIRAYRSGAAERLEEEIDRATVVSRDDLPADVVTMNSTVRFLDEDSGKESTVTLVYPHEASIDERRISILAPVGVALIGLRVGQTIQWPMPDGREKSFRVVAVRPRETETA